MRHHRSLSAVITLLLLTFWLIPSTEAQKRELGKPRIAVIEFKNKADNQWWYHGGAAAAQDVFVTELVKSGKYRVVDREQLEALMQEKHLTLSGDIWCKNRGGVRLDFVDIRTKIQMSINSSWPETMIPCSRPRATDLQVKCDSDHFLIVPGQVELCFK